MGVVALCDVLISDLAHLFFNEVIIVDAVTIDRGPTTEVAPVGSFTCCIKYRQILLKCMVHSSLNAPVSLLGETSLEIAACGL